MSVSIRLLGNADLESADAILKSAFRPSGNWIDELRLYRRIQPDGWFLALSHGSPAGMVGTVNYGPYAYVGLMAVHQEFQRQGIGLSLMQYLLAWLDSQSAPCVLLDASDKGQPMYKKLGFLAYDRTYVFQHCGVLPSCTPEPHAQIITVQELNDLTKCDRDVFGADRGKVLRALLATFPERAFMVRDNRGRVTGFIFAQRNRIGPWVAQGPQDAETLLRAALSLTYDGAVSVVAPEMNREGTALLKRYGFEIMRTNRHMRKGQSAPPLDRSKVYGLTSLALG